MSSAPEIFGNGIEQYSPRRRRLDWRSLAFLVACSIPGGIVAFYWGHSMGVNDVRAEFEVVRQSAMEKCGAQFVAFIDADNLNVVCLGGSQRQRGAVHE